MRACDLLRRQRKIALTFFSAHLYFQFFDAANNVRMSLAKMKGNLNACGGDGAVVNGKLRVSRNGGCRRSESDVSHDGAPVDGLLSHHLPDQEKVVDRAGLADR